MREFFKFTYHLSILLVSITYRTIKIYYSIFLDFTSRFIRFYLNLSYGSGKTFSSLRYLQGFLNPLQDPETLHRTYQTLS